MATPSDTVAPAPSTTTPPKPIHSLVLDTGPLIKNDPPADVLRSRAEALYILPSVLPEIRDPATRTRVETALMPFVTVRAPRPESIKVIQNFARRTGDLEVMSRPDIEVLALGYELECERNGGDWRLRSTPGQKTLNGKPPQKEGQMDEPKTEEAKTEETKTEEDKVEDNVEETKAEADKPVEEVKADETTTSSATEAPIEKDMEKLQIESTESTPTESAEAAPPAEEVQLVSGEKADEAAVLVEEDEEDSAPSDDEGGWITPSNVKKQKAKDNGTSSKNEAAPVTLQAAILTSDYAMQNVALRMNLNLVSPELTRISRLRTWVLRCHACFQITRAMDKRFCPSCGQATLLRAACTVDDRTGAMTVHLKKNFQWNNRGNVYSVPKPVHGTSNGRAPKGNGKGASNGGQNGWGRELIFAEDQKEFIRQSEEKKRSEKNILDVMDQDYLPGILGREKDRVMGGNKIRVGAGRNVNSRKKR